MVSEVSLKRSALVPMLLYAQDEIVTFPMRFIAEVAERIGITQLDVRDVASYYSMLRFKPAGKFNVQSAPTSVACCAAAMTCYERFRKNWASATRRHGRRRLFLERSQCIGVCCWAPAIQVIYEFHDELSLNTSPASSPDIVGKLTMPRLVSHPDESRSSRAVLHGRRTDRPIYRARRV